MEAFGRRAPGGVEHGRPRWAVRLPGRERSFQVPSCEHARGSRPSYVRCRSNPLPYAGYLPRRRRSGPTCEGSALRQGTRAYGGCTRLSVYHGDYPRPVAQRGCGFRLPHFQDGDGRVIDWAECRVVVCGIEQDFEPAPIGYGADQTSPRVCQRSAPSQSRSRGDREHMSPNSAMAAQGRLPFLPVSSGAQRQQRPTVSQNADQSAVMPKDGRVLRRSATSASSSAKRV